MCWKEVYQKAFGKLRKLWLLDLEATKNLTGGIENLYNISSLQFMHLSVSGLGGSLPDNFGSFFPSMVECLLSGNNFTGPIPSSIGEMRNLLHLNLAHNHFSGVIPKSLGTLPSLQILDLTNNNLVAFEDGFKVTSPLEVLTLAENAQLQMELTKLFDAFTASATLSLKNLNIARCKFHGEIPAELWKFKFLTFGDFSSNLLSGTLPIPWANSLFLLVLHFADNDIHGEIPQQFARLRVLQFLNVSGNPHMSCGTPPCAHSLPNFIEPDLATMSCEASVDSLRCPNALLSRSRGPVILDPENYHHKFCLCSTGSYGKEGKCLRCMAGGDCSDNADPQHHRMAVNDGHMPSPRDDNVTELIKTPCNELMRTGNVYGINSTAFPTYCWIRWNGNPNAPAVTVCQPSYPCFNGVTGLCCTSCAVGYYEHRGQCEKCSRDNNLHDVAAFVLLSFLVFILLSTLKRALKIALLVAQITLMVVLVLLGIIPQWILDVNIIALLFGLLNKRGKTVQGLAKIGVFYAQTLGDVWPPEQEFKHRFTRGVRLPYVTDMFNLRIPGLVCVFSKLSTSVGKLAFILFIPVVCICGAALLYGVWCVVLRYGWC